MCEKDYAGEEVMSDYQFKRYEEYRDKCERQAKEIDVLHRELAELRKQLPYSADKPALLNVGAGMTNYQFSAFLTLIYSVIKIAFEAGKSSEEILGMIEHLNKDSGEM